VKFETTPSFDHDYRALKREHQRAFRAVVPAFSAACDSYATARGYRWPAALRVSPLRGASGLWEMTWSFASPDGRATFEFVRRGDEIVCRWRRIGDHSVFRDP
jgi:hypothetical protein